MSDHRPPCIVYVPEYISAQNARDILDGVASMTDYPVVLVAASDLQRDVIGRLERIEALLTPTTTEEPQ